MISIMGKKYSKAVKQIIINTPIEKLNSKCTNIVNYGLSGDRLYQVLTKFSFIDSKHVINKVIGHSKYHVLQMAINNDILVPKMFLKLPITESMNKYLSKKYYSAGGKGIELATERNNLYERYYQEYIKNRAYELRVHAFKWLPKKTWIVQKRVGNQNTIAWNFSNGGVFQNIYTQDFSIYNNARDITELLLNKLNMSFGASDFIVTTDNKLYFLEINSAPGFTDFSKNIYIKAFTELTKLSDIALTLLK